MVSQDGKCAATVPANWGPAVTGVGMQVPKGRSYARAKLRDGTMADYKGLMTSMFKITKTFEDSAARYWIETGSQADDTMRHWSVAVPATAASARPPWLRSIARRNRRQGHRAVVEEALDSGELILLRGLGLFVQAPHHLRRPAGVGELAVLDRRQVVPLLHAFHRAVV